MADGLPYGRKVPGGVRQTNALSFYSLGNEAETNALSFYSLGNEADKGAVAYRFPDL